MRPRHRYRSESDSWGRNGVGMASRYSPEGSGRRHRIVDHERTSYHHYNRRSSYRHAGYSRGFQPSPSPPRETDIFVEAGKLAAEYLVDTGKLLIDPATGKWRTVDSGENKSTPDSRALARSGLEKHVRDAESGRRRYYDEYDAMGAETYERGGRRNYGSLRFSRPNMDKQLGRSGSWNERSGSSSDRNVDGDDSFVGHHKRFLEKDGYAVSQNSSPSETTFGGSASLLESDLEKFNSVEEGTKSCFFNNKKSLPLNVRVKLEIASDDTSGSIQESGEMNNHRNQNDLEQTNTAAEKEDSLVGTVQHSVHDFMKEDAQHSEVSGVNNAKDVLMDISTSNLDSATEDKIKITVCGKRALDGDNVDKESSKRHREWLPSMDAKFHVSKPVYMENQLPARQESITSESSYADPSNDQKSLSISLIPFNHANSSEILKEKQLFPGSFKTCDLNLFGRSDINENHHVPNSVVRMGKEAPAVNVGLSMSSNLSLSNKNGKHGVNANGIEIIDLEDEPAEEDQSFDESKRRMKDDYGLMTSAHIGDGGPFSSVTTDLDSSQGNMSLPKAEEILGNDDSVDMSPGKLPPSLPEFWNKPTQDYWKSF